MGGILDERDGSPAELGILIIKGYLRDWIRVDSDVWREGVKGPTSSREQKYPSSQGHQRSCSEGTTVAREHSAELLALAKWNRPSKARENAVPIIVKIPSV